MQFSQPSTARLVNRLRILNIVAQNEGLSRADVSRDLNLNKVSTSEIVDQLVGEGLLLETGRRQTSSGRPPTQLALQKEAKSVIAVDIGIRNTSVALVNMGGDILRFERFPTELQPTGEQIAVTVIKNAQKLLARVKDAKTVSGLAVALNGIVEPATGTVSSIPDWQWENVP
ncbi:MAG: ROK family protein, partial [Spirochaetales bacterium]|nr:ROK family protein [Spirochaetales bacterium]